MILIPQEVCNKALTLAEVPRNNVSSQRPQGFAQQFCHSQSAGFGAETLGGWA